ncbi:MAG: protein phosphatase 2C domain-containing protein [Firmicutes bacterium]|nr:protein phosphatase 2C domain-containing protein [Bacillota bacterium]
MLIDYAAITHQGHVRKNNEDAYLVSAMDGEEPCVNELKPLPDICQRGLLVAVADGMGGAAAGEVASREGLASLALYLFGHWGRSLDRRPTDKDLFRALKGAAEEASEAVIRYAHTDRAVRGMGSTLTAGVIWNHHLHLCQVGDSRAYLLRQGRLHQLTVDQTLVHQMIQSGYITAEEARNHPQRTMITQALGCPLPVKAELGHVALRRGDRLLVCSDGLHSELEHDQIESTLQLGCPLKRTLEVLLEKALAHGGRDNITAVLLSLDDAAFPPPRSGEPVQVLSPDLPSPGNGFLSRLSHFFSSSS